jgi:hypothetical protein
MSQEEKITRTIVPDEARIAFLPSRLQRLSVAFENRCYTLLTAQTREYKGGYWDFFTLSNGGFYMAPASYEEGFSFSVPGNQYQGHMSADAAGIVASLVALNLLLWNWPSKQLNDLFFQLRAFALEHAEEEAILGAID